MKTGITVSLAIVVIAAAGLAAPALAHNSGGHGYQGGSGMYFDPDNLVSMSGTVEQGFGNWQMRGHGNHTGGGMGFEFKAQNGEEFELMVAPAWFLEENGIALRSGERIAITGSLIDEYDNGNHHGNGSGHGGSGHGGQGNGGDLHDYLILTQIEADGVTLRLRDEEGYPLWRGGPDWNGHRWFDPDATTSMTGTLRELQGMWSSWGHGNHTGNGMHYIFDSDGGESFYAMVGPWWFMKGQGVKPGDGRRVELRGSVVDSYWSKYSDQRFFVATEIVIGNKTAQLRDDWGYPLWHGTGWHYSHPEWAKSSVQTLSGEVIKTQRKKHGRFLDKGYEVILRAGNQSYTLYVSPHWDVKHMGLKLRQGDQIRVKGSMVRGGQGWEMVAQYIEVNGERWHFRDKKGKPKWVKGAK